MRDTPKTRVSNTKPSVNVYEQPDLTAKVFAMVAEFIRARSQVLTPETTLFHGLGIDGDDAVDFFEEFGRGFHVDLEGFDID